MSQRRQNKQLSTMDNVESMTDQELREALKGYNQSPGPITDSTRNIYRKKLAALLEADEDKFKTDADIEGGTDLAKKLNLHGKIEDDDDDTSDEDYNAQDEEEEDEDEEDEYEDEEEIEDDLVDEVDGIKLANLSTGSDNLTASMRVEKGASVGGLLYVLLPVVLPAFIALFSLYYFYKDDPKNAVYFQMWRKVGKQFMILMALSPIGYLTYLLIRFYRTRRNEENQRVCSLVNDAMELLQSPDNPRGLMPILHIRDTLLTPPERKNKKMINIWNKAVQFIEDNESRVKVELVNIDGEDFRAWKWIGSRKL